MTALRVGIVGAGNMAQGYDGPKDSHVLTLAHAIQKCKAFTLGGFFDVDPKIAEAAEKKWGCPISARDRKTWFSAGWDVFCIASPTAQHAQDLRDALAARPKAIWIEKPLTDNDQESADLLQKADDANITLVVDFPRRWHSGVKAVREMIQNENLGTPTSALFVYSGGARHNASHMLDLFTYWWGTEWAVQASTHHGKTCMLSLKKENETIEASFVDLSASSHYVWEMHVYCTKGKIELVQSPEVLTVYQPALHPRYTRTQVLTPLARFNIEEEPMLERGFEVLAGVIAESSRSRVPISEEQAKQQWMSQVFEAIEKQKASAGVKS